MIRKADRSGGVGQGGSANIIKKKRKEKKKKENFIKELDIFSKSLVYHDISRGLLTHWLSTAPKLNWRQISNMVRQMGNIAATN